MAELKLIALDEADLAVISAHVQDAVLRVGDLSYLSAERRFLLAMNRFVWEKKTSFFRRDYERRRAALHFERVGAVKFNGLSLERADEVLSLLAIRFSQGDAPAGTIDLVFSGNATVRLEVECIEARLADLGAAWATASRPRHAG